jgi:hypothetical protein
LAQASLISEAASSCAALATPRRSNASATAFPGGMLGPRGARASAAARGRGRGRGRGCGECLRRVNAQRQSATLVAVKAGAEATMRVRKDSTSSVEGDSPVLRAPRRSAGGASALSVRCQCSASICPCTGALGAGAGRGGLCTWRATREWRPCGAGRGPRSALRRPWRAARAAAACSWSDPTSPHAPPLRARAPPLRGTPPAPRASRPAAPSHSASARRVPALGASAPTASRPNELSPGMRGAKASLPGGEAAAGAPDDSNGGRAVTAPKVGSLTSPRVACCSSTCPPARVALAPPAPAQRLAARYFRHEGAGRAASGR